MNYSIEEFLEHMDYANEVSLKLRGSNQFAFVYLNDNDCWQVEWSGGIIELIGATECLKASLIKQAENKEDEAD